MAEESVFKDLGPAQLLYLKSQYVTSLDMLDQAEKTLKAQLGDVTKARSEVEKQMRDLDKHLSPPAARPRKTAGTTRKKG